MRLKEDDYKKAIFGVSYSIYNDETPDPKDVDILFHAVNKQFGKKVLSSGNQTYKKYKCPSCNEAVNRQDRYCNHCGQKLDW